MSDELVLIVDDDPDIRTFLDVTLTLHGYTTEQAANGAEGVQKAIELHPAVILMDVMMPVMDGVTAVRRLRTDGRTSHLPIIVVTAKAQGADKVEGLAAGADDYITKPFDPDELVARVRTTLRRASEMRTVSPLTGLPGNARIEQELARRVAAAEPFALLYADLNKFKAYNDHYGFMRGDQVLSRCAQVIVDAVVDAGDSETFVGHIGGDDFVIMCRPDQAEPIAGQVCQDFDAVAPEFYDAEDRERGHIEIKDRQGDLARFGFVSVSIGITDTTDRSFSHPSQPVALATEMKSYAKHNSGPGSNYATDRRRDDDELD